MANEDRQQSKPEEKTLQEDNCSDCFTHQYLSAASSMNKSCIETSNASTFREFLPSREEVKNNLSLLFEVLRRLVLFMKLKPWGNNREVRITG